MKIKVVTVDLELSRRQKLIGAALAMLAVPMGVAFAAPPNTFMAGATLTAADLNENFAALDTDVAALQVSVADLEPAVTTLETSVTALQAAGHPKSAFKATRTTGMSIPTTAPTPITFDNEQFDLGNEYNPANGVFTVAAAGVYHLQCASHLTSGTGVGSLYSMIIVKNGAELHAEDRQASSASYLSEVASTVAQLAAGDTINCAFFQTSGSAVSLTPGVRTHFSAARVD